MESVTIYAWDGNSWEPPPTGPATTALAFATDPADCDLGEVAIGITTTGDLICAPDAGGVAGPVSAEVGQVATFAATDGQEIEASVLRATNEDIASTSDYNHPARVQLGSHKPFGPAGATVTAPCLSRFPSQFTANASAFAVESCTELGPGAATGEILAIHFADEGGQPPTFSLTSNVYQTGGGGLIFAGEYSTFANEAYRRIAWTDTDTIPALDNLVSFNVGIIRRGDGLLAINDGTRSGLSSAYRDLQARSLIADTFRDPSASTPASETATCTTGDTAWDSSYEYRCISSNLWVRSPRTWALPLYAGSASNGGPATSALAFATDPTDCDTGEVQVGSEIDGDAICAPEPTGGVTDHGALTGLADDDHPGAAWLAGRSGGQQLTGDTASGGNLQLRSTSHATKGAVTSDSPFRGPAGGASAPTFACSAYPSTGWYCDGSGAMRFSLDGSNAPVLTYNRFNIERDDGAYCAGDGADVCLKRSGTDEYTVTDGGSGYGRLRAGANRLVPRASEPFSCSSLTEGWEYANSVSHEKCYCNGTSWVGLVAGGSC